MHDPRNIVCHERPKNKLSAPEDIHKEQDPFLNDSSCVISFVKLKCAPRTRGVDDG